MTESEGPRRYRDLMAGGLPDGGHCPLCEAQPWGAWYVIREVELAEPPGVTYYRTGEEPRQVAEVAPCELCAGPPKVIRICHAEPVEAGA